MLALLQNKPVKQQPEPGMESRHQVAGGNVQAAYFVSRIPRNSRDEPAKIGRLGVSNRDAPGTGRDAERRERLRKVIGAARKQESEPVIEIDDVCIGRVEWSNLE